MIDVLVAAAIALAHPQTPAAPIDTTPTVVCQFEDGNPDGSPCVWTDPGTGATYDVDSSNYR
jgi:hypothetical protein